jgi:hypothetical protein
MAIVRHDIAEQDVVALRATVGDWPAGTEGTAVSIYEGAALIEVSGSPKDDTLDNLITVPADKVEAIWRPGDRPSGTWKPDGSLRSRERVLR